MSQYGDIEDAVVALLSDLSDANGTLFATVQGVSAADRKQALGVVERWLKPAAAVRIEGREKRVSSEAVAGDARLTVLIIAEGLRSSDASRRGDVDTRGAFALAGASSQALDGTTVGSVNGMTLLDEQVVSAGDSFVVIEQRYAVECLAGTAVPTFDGQVIAGSGASVSVTVGELESEAILYGFPGIDGAFRHELGTRSRTIQWTGQLRAADNAALSATESAIESLVGEGRVATVTDASGRSFDNCVVSSFARRGPRRIHATTGAVAQNFELVFIQLSVRN